ncbi:hypothetical protein [Nitratidesulfovibrio liaohensis]|uniref:hypothetical protein n=1 Tax=Nitratidesulfovibrio liaohensis TaxID=2604158 RepID=UPI002867C835|nr:hypothetical protein [Nitratidesulfovibrio liaohensis]
MAFSGGFLVATREAFSGGGLVSVMLSPCRLARSIPLIVGYVAGQGRLVEGRQAAGYAALFMVGLFIALIRVACALLGHMLGDMGLSWTIPVGALLLWVAFGMSGNGLMARLLRGSIALKILARSVWLFAIQWQSLFSEIERYC